MVPRLPEPSGGLPVGTTTLRLVDEDRIDPWTHSGPRQLMVSLWYPSAGTAGTERAPWMPAPVATRFADQAERDLRTPPGRIDWAATTTHSAIDAPVASPLATRPVLVYSHGMATTRAWNTVLVEELASRGYIVVTVDHTHEAFGVQFDDGQTVWGRPTGSRTEDGLAKPMLVRLQDTEFVLSALARQSVLRRLPGGLGSALDLERVALLGHSAGGITAAEAMAKDPRIDAGIDLDGFNVTSDQYLWPGVRTVLRCGLDRPFLILGSDRGSPAALPRVLTARSPRNVTFERLPGTRHFAFTDFQAVLPDLQRQLGLPRERITELIGDADPSTTLKRQLRLVTAFLDRHLSAPGRETGRGTPGQVEAAGRRLTGSVASPCRKLE